jgi:hypothetical protein
MMPARASGAAGPRDSQSGETAIKLKKGNYETQSSNHRINFTSTSSAVFEPILVKADWALCCIPRAQEFPANDLLQPKSGKGMLKLFSKAELR